MDLECTKKNFSRISQSNFQARPNVPNRYNKICRQKKYELTPRDIKYWYLCDKNRQVKLISSHFWILEPTGFPCADLEGKLNVDSVLGQNERGSTQIRNTVNQGCLHYLALMYLCSIPQSSLYSPYHSKAALPRFLKNESQYSFCRNSL